MRTLHGILAACALPLLPSSAEETAEASYTNARFRETLSQCLAEPLVLLDTDPRAEGDGQAHYIFITHQQLEILKRNYNPETFEKWVEKLKSVHLGMTAAEIQKTLSSKPGNAICTYGSGVTVCFELDDVYFVHGLFDENGSLKSAITKPIAITYKTSTRLIKALPERKGRTESLGLPK